jgi:hypothetical protein
MKRRQALSPLWNVLFLENARGVEECRMHILEKQGLFCEETGLRGLICKISGT